MSAETDIQFEVWQDGDMVAAADSLSDAEHFMVVYGQDGPVEAKTAVTVRTPGFTTRTPAPEGEVVAWRYRQRSGAGGWAVSLEDMSDWPNLICEPLYASPVVLVGGDDVEVVAEWLEIAKETPKPLHSSLNYVPVCASEIEAIERILAALRPTDTGWRDIETAPKDGTEFIAYSQDVTGNTGLNPFVSRCAWHPDAGFCTCELREVTHWMPLPLAPTDTGRE
jgi:hypothetical protein